jgi:nicotinamidase/pyrazinamidase
MFALGGREKGMDTVRYDKKTALLVVDVQNDFADPKGSLYVKEGEKVVPVINREIESAQAAGALVVYTQDWHPDVTPHFQKYGGVWPVHCVRGSWGAAFAPELRVEGAIVRKGTGAEDGYSGFFVADIETGRRKPTELEGLLRNHGIERVVIIGLATDYCVKETALDALRRGFATTVLREAIRAVNLKESDGARALEEIRQAGALVE